MLTLYPEVSRKNDLGQLEFTPDIDEACNAVQEACAGFGTDNDTLSEVLGSKTATQRYLISKRFPELHGKDLKKLVKKETSGKYEYLLSLVSVPIEEAEAQILRDATKGMGTTEKHLYPVICGRTNQDISILKKQYFKMFDEDLNIRIDGEVGGKLKDLLVSSLQELKEEFNAEIYTQEKAEADAKEFYAAGEGKWGTDEKAFFDIICKNPAKHLAAINAVYVEQYGVSMAKAAESELGGKVEDAALFAIGMNLHPADTIAQLFEKSMKGLGTDEKMLSMLVVRYHHVMADVRRAYKKRYDRTLSDRIHGETSGNYRKMLLTMVGEDMFENDLKFASKVITTKGDFISNGENLGNGTWVSKTRYVIWIPSWSTHWVAELSKAGMLTNTASTMEEARTVSCPNLEEWASSSPPPELEKLL